MGNFRFRWGVPALFVLCAIMPLSYGGCGHVGMNVRSTYNPNGSCECVADITADGMFASQLQDPSFDLQVQNQGWSVETKNEGDAVRKTLKRRFDSAAQLGSSSSLFRLAPGAEPGSLTTDPGKFTRRKAFPYTYYDYEEIIKPHPDIAMDKCLMCDGTGGKICKTCQRTGTESCPACRGKGQDGATPGQPVCVGCSGNGRITCRDCEGKGKLLCPFCDGTGRPGQYQSQAANMVNSVLTMKGEVKLPGTLITTNADQRTGDVSGWIITMDRIRGGMTMKATSRGYDYGGIASVVIGCLVILAALLVIVKCLRSGAKAAA